MAELSTAHVAVPIPRFQPAELPAFAKKRESARQALKRLDLPTDKKYTNWRRLGIDRRFADKAVGGRSPHLTIEQDDYDTGYKSIAIPLRKAIQDWPDRVSGYLMGPALPADYHYFSALAGSLYTDGAVAVVPRGTEAAITATFSAESGKLNAYRTIIVVDEGATATFIERTDRGVADAVIAHGVEIYLKPGSKLHYYGMQRWSSSVTYLPVYRSLMESGSRLDWLLGSFGSGLTQLQVESGLAGEGAETNIHTVYFGSGRQHLEQSLVANHLSPNTTSDTYARGLVNDTSKAVYRGMIKIQSGAHGSSADQNGRAMLLKDTAHADAIPGLEIDANDVTAGHGATVGQIDEEQLFYMMARGLSQEEATSLLIEGFFEDMFRLIERPETRREFTAAVRSKLATARLQLRGTRWTMGP